MTGKYLFLFSGASFALATAAQALTPADVRQMPSGGVEITSGRCAGLIANDLHHASIRCDCMQKLGGRVQSGRYGGTVDIRGIGESKWQACVGS